MRPTLSLVLALGVSISIIAPVAGVQAQIDPVVAIDIALEPDQGVEDRALATNAELKRNYPKGYALDATHRAHVTILQRYVRTADLEKVYRAASAVITKEDVAHWKLTGESYYTLPANGVGAVMMAVRRTPDLVRLQQELIAAEAPFTVKSGNTAAFFTTPEEPDIVPSLIRYVGTYVPKASGDYFVPHVPIGVANVLFTEKLAAEPFDPITFSPIGASVYQVGNYGMARKELYLLPLPP